jgi:hypothetical protein
MLGMIPVPGVFIAGVIVFLVVLWDAFEAIILPRRVTRKFRLTRIYYLLTWRSWKFHARMISSQKRRESFLGFYGPISLLFLIGVWAFGLVVAFGMMQYGAGSAVNVTAEGAKTGLNTDFYLSGTTFFTLGLGDVIPRSNIARFLVVTEAGFGFGFLAAVIGYLPFIYGAFGRRETNISLLDARAGTPPTAGELLRRHSYPSGNEALGTLLAEWELWCAELLESHLSYPVLAYFRSQHDNQSWIGALTAILDTCALTIAGIDGACAKQAELTFAIARHAVADLCQVFSAPPRPPETDRLPRETLKKMRFKLAEHHTTLTATPEADEKLQELRGMYEPYVNALARHLNQSLPPWIPDRKGKDNWQTTAWAQAVGAVEKDPVGLTRDDHF